MSIFLLFLDSWVCHLPQLLSFLALWWQARLLLPETVVQKPLPPPRIHLWLCLWLEHVEVCKWSVIFVNIISSSMLGCVGDLLSSSSLSFSKSCSCIHSSHIRGFLCQATFFIVKIKQHQNCCICRWCSYIHSMCEWGRSSIWEYDGDKLQSVPWHWNGYIFACARKTCVREYDGIDLINSVQSRWYWCDFLWTSQGGQGTEVRARVELRKPALEYMVRMSIKKKRGVQAYQYWCAILRTSWVVGGGVKWGKLALECMVGMS